jgi:hypothetical protein
MSAWALVVLILLQRFYWPVEVRDLAQGKVTHTHVQVIATVLAVRHEADGDTHLVLGDGRFWVIGECIPKIPCPVVHRGERVRVRGISRYDREHSWYEIHPVEEILRP